MLARQNMHAASHHKEKKEKLVTVLSHFDKYILLKQHQGTTANISAADFDGDSHPDILFVKARHWPIIDRVLLPTEWVE